MKKEKTLVAMSGGVDSSVAAYLMTQRGWDCEGAIALMWGRTEQAKAVHRQNVADAQAIAQRLGIPFHTIDASAVFEKAVVCQFIDAYQQGLTPNPCIQCNQHIKFSALLDKALALGCDCIATGHYARIVPDPETGRYLLKKAVDEGKDQSYFLACLDQYQLAHAQFPLGDYSKAQIREIAEAQGFLTAKKRDSQDICFIPDGDYAAFIAEYTGQEHTPGAFLDSDGKVVGQHGGAIRYTLGQRKGLGLAMGAPVYVCAKDMGANTVTVGPESSLYTQTLFATDWNWIPFPALTGPMRVIAKARYRHIPQPATVYPEADGIARVVFDEPQRAITPGQTVVLYDRDLVVGSGTITKSE